jgi:regulator of protease activity HflC (stomatin/prohibitin superfamily)
MMESIAEIAVGVFVELILASVAGAVLFLLWGRIFGSPKRMRVLPFQMGVILRGERVLRTVGPGSYWITPKCTLALCDARSKPFQLAGIECIANDGLAVRVSLGGEYRVSDPARFVSESSDAFGAFYLDLRQSLNTAVGELSSSHFMGGHPQVTARMKELLVPRATQLGIELTQLDLWEALPTAWLRSN